MSDIIWRLRDNGKNSAWTLYDEAADLIEQQQTRISELEQREAELAEENKHMNHIMQSHEAVCNDLGKVITERDELTATVGRAQEFMVNNDMLSEYSIGDLEDILRATPHQNLNAVKRSAYQKGFCDGACYASQVDYPDELTVMGAEQGAAQRYPR